MKKKKIKKETLCWDCQKAVKQCSWSKDFVPVDGWKATKTRIKLGKKVSGEFSYSDSYMVLKCPQFVEDVR